MLAAGMSNDDADGGNAVALGWAIRHCERAAAHGFSVDQLLRDSLVAEFDGEGQPEITSSHLALLCINLILQLDDELQGSARQALPAGLMAMGVRVMLGAERLETGIIYFLRFLGLASSCYRGKLETNGDTAILSLEIDRDPSRDILPGEETLIAGTHMYMSWFAGRTIPIFGATTRCADNPALRASPSVFIKTSTRLSNRTSIEFPKACLRWERRATNYDRPVTESLRFAMDNLWTPQTFAFGYKAKLTDASYAAAVLRSLDLRPGAGVADVSSELGITPITLWRYLRDEGTSFLKLRQSWLVRRAVDQLRRTDIGLEDLADVLGFSDARSLRHSIKSLTGMTPSQFRSTSDEVDRLDFEQETLRQRIMELGTRLEA